MDKQEEITEKMDIVSKTRVAVLKEVGEKLVTQPEQLLPTPEILSKEKIINILRYALGSRKEDSSMEISLQYATKEIVAYFQAREEKLVREKAELKAKVSDALSELDEQQADWSSVDDIYCPSWVGQIRKVINILKGTT